MIFSISAMMSSRLATPMSTGNLLASLSSSIPWMFAGVGDRDPEPVARVGNRNRDDPLEGQQRHQLGSAGDDALRLQVDEGQIVASGERAGNALRLRIPLVAQRLGQRARAGAPARGGKPIARDHLGSEDEVGDQVAHRLEARAGAALPVGGRPGTIAEIGGGAEWA